MLYFCRKRPGCGLWAISDPIPTTTPGTSRLPDAAWIIVRSSCELYITARTPLENRLEHRQADRRVALGRRNQDGARSCRTDAVVCMVVAIAEEQTVVVAAAVPGDVVDQRRRGRALRVEPVQFVAKRVALLEDAIGSAAEELRVALALHAKASRRHAVDRFETFAGDRCAMSRSRWRTWSGPRPLRAWRDVRRRSGRGAPRRR